MYTTPLLHVGFDAVVVLSFCRGCQKQGLSQVSVMDPMTYIFLVKVHISDVACLAGTCR